MKSPEIQRKTYANKAGIGSWIYGGLLGPEHAERYLYTIHRLTGLGVLVYLVMHIFVTWFKNEPEVWDYLMGMINTPAFHFGEYLVFFGVVFHAMNGIRLIVGELGYLLGDPRMPVYPYPIAAHRQRPFVLVMMLLTAVFAAYGAIEMFTITH